MISAFKPQRGRNRKFRPQQKIAPSFHTPRVAQPQMRITPPTQDVKGAPRLRIMALGGLEEVGRNSTIFEYGKDIVIVDLGVQFPEENMPGVDFVIPNIEYLRGREHNIKGVAITHGHLDHVGAASYVLPRIGNPTVYAPALAKGIMEKRHEEFRTREKLNIHAVNPGDIVKLGNFQLEFFHVNHNIPDSMGIAIHTPEGIVIHTGDFKFDHSPVGDKPANIAAIAKFHDMNVIALMCDSTSCENKGYAISEKEIMATIDGIFAATKGRLIVGVFSSHLGRIQQLLNLAEKYGRKVAIEGRSMRNYTEIAHGLKKIDINPKIIVETEEINRLPDNRVLILATGAQGEENAALMRIATNQHKSIHLKRGDTVLFSSSVIAGNERSVQHLRDNLYRYGAKVINYRMMDVHSGGHGWSEDNKLMIRLVNPKYFIPIHGQVYMRSLNGEIAESIGFPKTNVFLPDNGQVMEFSGGRGRILKDKINADHVMVDGLGVGDVSNVVLRDRVQLAEDGMFVVIMTVDGHNGTMIGDPDIISRGFTFMKERSDIIEGAKQVVRNIFKNNDTKAEAEFDLIKKRVRDDIGRFLYGKTQRRPMVLPVIIET
jgi:ribonuclease J